jgi:hypothetical protein
MPKLAPFTAPTRKSHRDFKLSNHSSKVPRIGRGMIDCHILTQLGEGITGRPSHDPTTMAFKHHHFKEANNGSTKGKQKSICKQAVCE